MEINTDDQIERILWVSEKHYNILAVRKDLGKLFNFFWSYSSFSSEELGYYPEIEHYGEEYLYLAVSYGPEKVAPNVAIIRCPE